MQNLPSVFHSMLVGTCWCLPSLQREAAGRGCGILTHCGAQSKLLLSLLLHTHMSTLPLQKLLTAPTLGALGSFLCWDKTVEHEDALVLPCVGLQSEFGVTVEAKCPKSSSNLIQDLTSLLQLSEGIYAETCASDLGYKDAVSTAKVVLVPFHSSELK